MDIAWLGYDLSVAKCASSKSSVNSYTPWQRDDLASRAAQSGFDAVEFLIPYEPLDGSLRLPTPCGVENAM